MAKAKILGAILAGGQSRRFGSDKAEAQIDGTRLIDLVAAALDPQIDTLVICGREEAVYPSLADEPEAGIGPLGGLMAALKFAGENGYTAVLSASCDAPGLPDDLFDQLDGEGPAIVESQPVIGVWPSEVLPVLDAFIAEGGRSLYGFARRAGARSVRLTSPLANINRTEDLERYKI